jgi:hypothetical protein
MEVGWALGGLGGVQSQAERRSSEDAGVADSGNTDNLSFRQQGGRAVSLGYAKTRIFPSAEVRRRESSVFSEGS